jgi:hypothetical protein
VAMAAGEWPVLIGHIVWRSVWARATPLWLRTF